MKVLEQTEATAPLAEYTAGIDQEPVIITSNGKLQWETDCGSAADRERGLRDGIVEHQS
jgi:hypothetical protein